MNITKIDIIIIIAYFIFLVLLGFFRKPKATISQRDYIIHGRKLSLPGFVISLVSTWYGAILGVGENTYLYGIQTWFIFGLPYYFFAVIYAFWLSKKIWSKNILSIPDVFRSSYGENIGIISAVFIFLLSSPAPYILSLGVLINFAFDIELIWCIFIATGFSTIYVWNGGISAIVKTDYLQMFLMFVGFLLLVCFSWYNSVSPLELYSSLPDSHLDPLGGNSLQYISVWFFIAIWTIIDPNFFQRVASVKSAKIAKKGLIISIFLWFIFDLITITAGLYAFIFIVPDNPVMSYPLLGLKVLPPGFLGLFIVSLFAIIMSTIDSMSFVNAITIGRDIIWRLRKKDSRKNPVFLIKNGLIIVAILSILLSILIPSVVKMLFMLGSLFIPGLIIPFINAIFNKKLYFTEKNMIIWIVMPICISTFSFIMAKLGFQQFSVIEPFYLGMFTSIIFFGYFRIKSNNKT